MNRYPAWLNVLVLIIFVVGGLVAMPNVYGTAPAVQLAKSDGNPYGANRIQRVEQALERAGITPGAIYEQDGRIVVRFSADDDG